MTALRTVLWPIKRREVHGDAVVAGSGRARRRCERADDPQLPATIDVTPMRMKFSASGFDATSSACVWTSMKPGARTRPVGVEALARLGGRNACRSGDPAVADADVARARGRAGAVDDAGVRDHEIERRLLLGSRRAPSRLASSDESIARHD